MFNSRSFCDQWKANTPPPSDNSVDLDRGKLQCCCDLCETAFDSDTEVQEHRSIAHQDKLYEIFKSGHGCYICLQSFKLPKELIAHIRRAHFFIRDPKGTKITCPIFVCDICSSLFYNKQMLAFHVYYKHKFVNSSRKLDCPKCSKPTRIKSMTQHLDYVHMKSIKCCPICMEYQPTMSSYYAHIDKNHASTLTCNFCKYLASTETELNSHLESTHGRKATPAHGSPAAHVVFRPFRDEESTRRLKPQFMYRGINLYNMINICILCQETCSTMQQMRHHLKTEHGHNMLEPPEETPAEAAETPQVKGCKCGATFKTKVMLRHHIFREHELGQMLTEGQENTHVPDEQMLYW